MHHHTYCCCCQLVLAHSHVKHAAVLQGVKTAEQDEASSSGTFYTPQQISDLDPKQVRRVLVSLGLPGAGTPQKLSQRLMAVAEAVAGGAQLEAAVEQARRLR